MITILALTPQIYLTNSIGVVPVSHDLGRFALFNKERCQMSIYRTGSRSYIMQGGWRPRKGNYQVYIIFDKTGNKPVYVGMTSKTVTERMAGHLSHSNDNLLYEWLYEQDCFRVIIDSGWNSGKLARIREVELIQLLNTPYNIAGSLNDW